MWHGLLLGATLALSAVAVAAGTDRPPPQWHTAHADGRNSDFAPMRGARRLRHAWTRDLEGMGNLGVTVRDGLVFATSSGPGCRLHVLRRADGRTLWCSRQLDPAAVASAPLLDGGDGVFVPDGEGLHAFDGSGTHRWTLPLAGVPLSLQWMPDGSIGLATHQGFVHVVDPRTGDLRQEPCALFAAATDASASSMRACMRGDAGCPVANTPAVDPASGRMFLTAWPADAAAPEVWAIDGLQPEQYGVPRIAWRAPLAAPSASSPTLSHDHGSLYVTDNSGLLYALDAGDGTRRWTWNIGYASDGSASVSPDGLVIPAGGRDAAVLAIRDAGMGPELQWRLEERHLGVASQASGNLAYVTVGGAQRGDIALAVVDTRSGDILERHALGRRQFLAAGTSIDEAGWVYVMTIRGTVFAFRPAD